jgi:hypothetical protein
LPRSPKGLGFIQGEEMATIAEGTGGGFFHDSNNYDEGIARTAAAPEYLYVLGFSPLDLKLDGKYHGSRRSNWAHFRASSAAIRSGPLSFLL